MMNFIEIDGKKCTEFGLFMAKLPVWTIAAETVETTALPNVAVQSDRHTGQYPDFELTFTGYTVRPASTYDIGQLYKWIASGKELIMSTQPELVGRIRKVDQIEPARIGTIANEIKIPITFKPFKYTREDFPQTVDCSAEGATTFTLYNRGNIFCEPKFTLTFAEGATEEYIEVNGERLTIAVSSASSGDPITVDVERKKVYKVSGGVATVIQSYTSGRFWAQVLESGWNTVTVSANVTAVEVTKNERWL